MELIRRNTEYAIRALVHLATCEGEVVSAKEIAGAQDIPVEFLQKILQRLVRARLVVSHRGKQGGFSLARKPGEVSLLEVVTTIQGQPAANKCFLGRDGCERAASCRLKQNWLALEQKVNEFLADITLQDLADQIHGK
uniref:Rrf2 family transcriptional regulator n=1 Tax=Ammonifex degensii TaxID=42838 RepID=A0A7C2EI45_9THEO